jgi:hypothetical protein
MNGKTGGGPRRAGALAVMAAAAVLATGCGLVHVHFSASGGPAPAGQAAFQANLAFARCMRAHGVPHFPEPTNSSESFHIRSSESFHISGHPNGKVTGPRAQAVDACKHLLPPGSVTTG